MRNYCACYCKDTHFEAIHNANLKTKQEIEIVLATAKIHILKQFTTLTQAISDKHKLCLLLQRYTFWSNSQQQPCINKGGLDCACYCKDTHFEAIHNVKEITLPTHKIVLATAKIHILKQFTTEDMIDTNIEKIVLATAKIHILKQFTTLNEVVYVGYILCLLLQRYTFWSNSQHSLMLIYSSFYCACYCKDTHFEAIHNSSKGWETITNIVLATAKIHILKQFTTYNSVFAVTHELCLLLQRYTFWSNSQQILNKILSGDDCACYCKDTHFEAIHNFITDSSLISSIVLATAKIHILKQFTTQTSRMGSVVRLCLLLQRYTFWSNSQRKYHPYRFHVHCACYCKDTHFEAIHNYGRYQYYFCSIVLATAKIHILKQFTTIFSVGFSGAVLCLLLQRYTFWSNSQHRHSHR